MTSDEPALEWVEPDELAPAEDRLGETLRALNERYAIALATADGDALCALFESDGAIIDADGPDAVSQEGLRDMAHYARERYGAVSFEIHVAWTKADPLDPARAWAGGTWRMAFVPHAHRGDGHGGGSPVRSHGTFLELWHRDADGTWRLHRDITLSRDEG